MVKLPRFSKVQVICISSLFIIGALLLFSLLSSEVYSAQIQVVLEPEKIELNPSSQSLDFGSLAPEMSARRYITLRNSGFFPAFVWIGKSGALASWLKIEPRTLSLFPSQHKRLTISLEVPSFASLGLFQGEIKIFKFPF